MDRNGVVNDCDVRHLGATQSSDDDCTRIGSQVANCEYIVNCTDSSLCTPLQPFPSPYLLIADSCAEVWII